MPMKHIDIRVAGLVQGVGFRYSAMKKADELGLTGTVRNDEDDSVRIQVEGDSQALDMFKEWCRHGPRGAQVTDLVSKEGPLKGFDSFRIVD
jgi:acylphosphatase